MEDGIVDEHALLLFIQWNAERPKWNRRSESMPGTRVGAVSIYRPFKLVLY